LIGFLPAVALPRFTFHLSFAHRVTVTLRCTHYTTFHVLGLRCYHTRYHTRFAHHGAYHVTAAHTTHTRATCLRAAFTVLRVRTFAVAVLCVVRLVYTILHTRTHAVAFSLPQVRLHHQFALFSHLPLHARTTYCVWLLVGCTTRFTVPVFFTCLLFSSRSFISFSVLYVVVRYWFGFVYWFTARTAPHTRVATRTPHARGYRACWVTLRLLRSRFTATYIRYLPVYWFCQFTHRLRGWVLYAVGFGSVHLVHHAVYRTHTAARHTRLPHHLRAARYLLVAASPSRPLPARTTHLRCDSTLTHTTRVTACLDRIPRCTR